MRATYVVTTKCGRRFVVDSTDEFNAEGEVAEFPRPKSAWARGDGQRMRISNCEQVTRTRKETAR